MRELRLHSYLFTGGAIALLSTIVLIINHFTFGFIGNNYFPDGSVIIACILVINFVGLIIFFGNQHRITRSGFELINLFVVMCLIAYATNAVQLTPFDTIDKQIYEIENRFGINLIDMMKWLSNYPTFKLFLSIIYDTLPYQMSILPLCVIISGQFNTLRDYYLLMLMTTFIGFTIYYFFPTTAPASIINSALFLPEQVVTGLKFFQIHHHILPSSIEGGLIAMPSFHTIWAILCVYLIKDWKIPCVLLSIINVLLIISCVLLGWHYPSDIVAGIVLIIVSFFWLRWLKS